MTTSSSPSSSPLASSSGGAGSTIDPGKSRRRRWVDYLFWATCALAFVIIVAPTIAILVDVAGKAGGNFGLHTFTQDSNANYGGGLKNEIAGTLVLLVGVLIVAGVIGIGAGIYLAEFATSKVGGVLRFFSEILAGMPSIVIGYIAFVSLVVAFHWSTSLLAAVLALSVLVLPYIIKNTEVALRQVPSSLREAAAGLGVTRGRALVRILLPTALPGIISGLILAMAISTGETAPLLFTAGTSEGSFHLALAHQPVPYLTAVVYNVINFPQALKQGYTAALVLLLILLVLIVAGRLVAGHARKKTAQMTL